MTYHTPVPHPLAAVMSPPSSLVAANDVAALHTYSSNLFSQSPPPVNLRLPSIANATATATVWLPSPPRQGKRSVQDTIEWEMPMQGVLCKFAQDSWIPPPRWQRHIDNSSGFGSIRTYDVTLIEIREPNLGFGSTGTQVTHQCKFKVRSWILL